MSFTFADYQTSADYLRGQLKGFVPKVAMVLGSGLGYLAEKVEDPIAVPFYAIPYFRRSTAPGHAGRLVFGKLDGQNVAVMQGRFHHYEGYSFEEVTFPIRVLRLLGAETLIVTNAAGCVNESWQAGDLMLISDHIKLTLDSPLCGPNLPEFGPRFPDSTYNYTPALRKLAHEVAQEQGIPMREGFYLYLPGPQYETPAEIRAARILGADAVGMSTVPEVIVARHCGMQVLGVTLLTNMAAGILDQPLTEEEVLTAAQEGKEKFSGLVRGCLEKM
ncbi:MAG: purine-nucleoside phosphorylase [Clostridiales bacterium]|nr:purine-nucleoside phosphorylase [Clostridiales bacterium]